MGTLMGTNQDSVKRDMGPVLNSIDTLEVSMYPKGDEGTTFFPSVDDEGNLSWTNNGNRSNPDTINIHGVDITNVEQTTIATEDGSTNIITIDMSDGQSHDILIKNGNTGAKGDTPTVNIGTVTTGTNPSVTNSGTDLNVVLDFVIPEDTRKINLNGGEKDNPAIYAPVSSGIKGQKLISQGENLAPEWTNDNDDYNNIYKVQSTITSLSSLVNDSSFRKAIEDVFISIYADGTEKNKNETKLRLDYYGSTDINSYSSIVNKESVLEITEQENQESNSNEDGGLSFVVAPWEQNNLGAAEVDKKYYSIYFNDNKAYSKSSAATPVNYIIMKAHINDFVSLFGFKCQDAIMEIKLEVENITKLLLNRNYNGKLTVSLKNNQSDDCLVFTADNEEFTDDDVARAGFIILGEITPTEEDIERYDIDRDGEISFDDAEQVNLRKIYNFNKNNPIRFGILSSSEKFPEIGFVNSNGVTPIKLGYRDSNFSNLNVSGTLSCQYGADLYYKNGAISHALARSTIFDYSEQNGTIETYQQIFSENGNPNFLDIEIFYYYWSGIGLDQKIYDSVKVRLTELGQYVTLSSCLSTSSNMTIASKTMSINEDSISLISDKYMETYFVKASSTFNMIERNNIWIYRVDGIKGE